MYDVVLVPLDGSAVAETALDGALELVRNTHGRLILLRVVRPAESFTPEEAAAPPGVPSADQVMLAVHDRERAKAAAYLAAVRERLASAAIAIDCVVGEGHPAVEILLEAEARGASLIMMAPRGASARLGEPRSGVLGSVCDAVLRNSRLPVLVMMSGESVTAAAPIEYEAVDLEALRKAGESNEQLGR